MTEITIVTVTEQGLRVQFQSTEKRDQFIDDMNEHGIDFFVKGSGNNVCDVSHYSLQHPFGLFFSEHRRVALQFSSDEQKFFFKERIGLESDCFMDMGPRHETQLHFNEKRLPPVPGSSITATRESYSPSVRF